MIADTTFQPVADTHGWETITVCPTVRHYKRGDWTITVVLGNPYSVKSAALLHHTDEETTVTVEVALQSGIMFTVVEWLARPAMAVTR